MHNQVEGFNYPKAVELGLTNDDLVFLRWWLLWVGSGRMDTFKEDGRLYSFIAHWKVAEELPSLVYGIEADPNAEDPEKCVRDAQARKIGRFLNRLVEKELFVKKVVRVSTTDDGKPTCKTTRVYYAATEKLIPLLMSSEHMPAKRKAKKGTK